MTDDLIAFAITETFGARCSTFDEDCYTCRAWAKYDRLASHPSDAAAVKILRDALGFYADRRRYDGSNLKPIPDDPFAEPGMAYMYDVTRDHGSVARAALDAITVAPPAGDAVREALEPLATYKMVAVGFNGALSRNDLKDCTWVAGFTGPQPEFRHFDNARAALGREDKAGVDPLAGSIQCHCHDAISQRLCLDKDRCSVTEAQSVGPSEPTAASAQEVVGWMAFCPDTGGRCVEHTEDAAKYHGAICYAPDHDFIVVPLYTHPVAKPDVEAIKAANRVSDLIADLQGEHEFTNGRFDASKWKIEVPVTDLELLITAISQLISGATP